MPYSCEQMFDLVAAIDRYPEFLPWCLAADIKERRGKKVTADLVIGYKLFRERFTSLVTLDRAKSIMVEYQSGPMSHLSNSWKFRPHSQGCLVDFHVDFDFRSPLLSSLMAAFFDRAFARMVQAFEERAAQLYKENKALKR